MSRAMPSDTLAAITVAATLAIADALPGGDQFRAGQIIAAMTPEARDKVLLGFAVEMLPHVDAPIELTWDKDAQDWTAEGFRGKDWLLGRGSTPLAAVIAAIEAIDEAG